ncbi:MAG: hypothetical protein ACO1SV_00100 [Fimbriimonas sp.]
MAFAYPALLVVAAFLRNVPVEKEGPFAPIDAAFGHDSSVTTAQVLIAKDQAGWNQMWATHRGTSGANLPGNIRLADDRPPVDFRKNFVVGVFGGTTQEIEGYEVVATVTDDKTAFVRFVPIPPAIRQAIPQVTQPYGFAILPRTKLRIEIQVPNGRDQWRTVAKFEPTAEAKKKQ